MFKLNIKTAITFTAVLLSFFNFNQVLARVLPNDPDFSKQSYFDQIGAGLAWEKVTGVKEVVVAVIDSGVDISHPDLIDNIWTNKNEIPGDGLDNDNNGYVDDVNGWDFLAKTQDPQPKIIMGYSASGISHGTFVSGIIAATGNNKTGITGICWHCKIMPLRVLDGIGNGGSEELVKAINYAADNGADIINFSIVTWGFSDELGQAIKNAYDKGKIIIAAAGNETQYVFGADGGYDLDYVPFYPVCYDNDNNNIIGVASINKDDVKSSFSNYGQTCVDMSAPGEKFYGLNYYNPLYSEFRDYYVSGWSGTSMAAPVVSGAAALVKSLNPELTAEQIYDLLVKSGDDLNLKNPAHPNQLGKKLNLKKLIDQAISLNGTFQEKILASASKNGTPVVTVFDLNGFRKNQFYPYGQKFNSGINAAAGNISGSWSDEIVTAPSSNGLPVIKIFDNGGKFISQFNAYDKTVNKGVNLALLRYDNESLKKIVTAPAGSAKPLIKIFDDQGKELAKFLAFDEKDQTGVNVATGDVNGDGLEEIIASQNKNTSLIRIFNQAGGLLFQFEAYGQEVRGLKISAADLNNDDKDEIVATPANDKINQVKVFDYWGNVINKFSVFGETIKGGLNLTAGDINFDGQSEIAVSANGWPDPRVKIYSASGVWQKDVTISGFNFNQGIKINLIN